MVSIVDVVSDCLALVKQSKLSCLRRHLVRRFSGHLAFVLRDRWWGVETIDTNRRRNRPSYPRVRSSSCKRREYHREQVQLLYLSADSRPLFAWLGICVATLKWRFCHFRIGACGVFASSHSGIARRAFLNLFELVARRSAKATTDCTFEKGVMF